MNWRIFKITKLLYIIMLTLFISGCSQSPSESQFNSAKDSFIWCEQKVDSNSIIIQQACNEVAELSDNSLSNIDKVRSLRSWVSSWWAFSKSGSNEMPIEYWKIEPEVMFSNGRAGLYGGACGSTAWMLMKVYEEFGLPTWIYNFGNPAGIGTHVVTLVSLEGLIIVQDAYLNTELVGVDGSPVDVRQAINLTSLEAENKITFTHQQGVKRCIARNPKECLDDWMFKSEKDSICKLNTESTILYLCYVSNFVGSRIELDERFWTNVREFLKSEELEPSVSTLMLFPIGITGIDGITAGGANLTGGVSQVLFKEILRAANGKL